MAKPRRSMRRTDFVVNPHGTCSAHPAMDRLMISFDKRLRVIEKNQKEYMLQSAETNKIVKNGLQKQFRGVAKALRVMAKADAKYQKEMNLKIAPLDNFKWFMDFATKFRDKSWKYVLAVFSLIVITLALSHITEDTFKWLWKVILSKIFGG